MTKRFRRITLALTLATVLAHYLWSASSSGNPFRFERESRDYYNLLVDGLLSGRLSLPVTPPPPLLQLPDPYDPHANRGYRIPYRTQDLSLYASRFYLYFGIAPALTLYAPFRLFAGLRLPENLALALLLFGSVAWSAASLWLVAKRFVPDAGFGLMWLSIVLLGFSNFAPFLLRRPAVYEVAMAAGSFFMLGGVYWLLRALLVQAPRRLPLLLGSLFLGLAAASRPVQALGGLFLPLAYAFMRSAASPRERPSWRDAAVLAAPWAVSLTAVLLYNQARFGEPLEFGMRYQITSWNQFRGQLFSLSYIPIDLFLHFLQPPQLGLEFPFFSVGPVSPLVTPPGHLAIQATAGLISCVPMATLAFLWPVLLLRQGTNASLLHYTGTALLGVAVVIALAVSTYAVASLRYLLDFCGLLLLSAALAAIYCHGLLKAHPLARRAFGAGCALLVAYSTVLNLAIGLTGYNNWLRHRNQPTYEAIEDAFFFVQRALLSLRPRRYGDATLNIRLGETGSGSGSPEVLVAAGGTYRHDVLCIRRLPDGRLVFRFHHRDDTPLRSHPVGLPAHTVHLIEVSMGSLYPVNPRVLARLTPDGAVRGRRLTVRLDGEELLSGDFDFTPSPSKLVTFGRDTRDDGQCPTPFSGEILSVERSFPPG